MNAKVKCSICGRSFGSLEAKIQHSDMKHPGETIELSEGESAPDWSGKCLNCGSSPIHPVSGLCGPCTFGKADTAGGNW